MTLMTGGGPFAMMVPVFMVVIAITPYTAQCPELSQGGYKMKAKIMPAAAIVLSFAAPAVADEYYVVRGPDRHCTVTTTRPAKETTITQIGPLAFESREKAEERIKTTKVCSDTTTTGTSVHIDKD